MSRITLKSLSVSLGPRRVIEGVDLEIRAGECVGLIGPNGAGKSTLMRAALGLIPAEGESNMARMTPDERARHVAWLPQSREIAWALSVEKVVAIGRAPHRRPGAPLSEADRAAITASMAEMEVSAFATRPATQLSGGEQARVLLARALAQETPILMADEPIAGLDPAHQLAAMETFARLAADGRTVLCALHDLALAARWCTRLVMLDRGRIVADGPPDEVLTAERLAAVYGIVAHLDRVAGQPIVQPLSRVAP
ncbi:MAG: ABC transporter ATP-binding protein [Pseudomonadota bacterium]